MAVKRKVVKKAKKVVKRKSAKSKKFTGELAFCIQKEYGYVTVGVAESVKDLAKKLSKASDNVFKHHLRSGANDFADWAEKCVKNKNLAKKLRSVKLGRTVSVARKKILKILKEA